MAGSCIRGAICARPIYVVQHLGGFKRGAAQSIAMDNLQTGLSLSVRIALTQTHTPESKRWYVMAKDEHNELPLQSVMELAYSEEEGSLIVTYRKRGFLSDLDVSNTKKTRWKPPFRPDGKVALTALGKRLRGHLDARGLPTDKWPVMPVESDSGYNPKEHGIVEDEDLWIGWVEDSTEPLTKDRIAADLLYATNSLLASFSEEQLRDVFQAMRLYHLYSMVGELNELAASGEASKKGRAKGPSVKKERARKWRELILAIAVKFWEQNPRWVGQPVNTAKKIAQAVNQMRAARQPGCAPLATKTIADHLRVALAEAQQLP
jgi:hypothetical protein